MDVRFDKALQVMEKLLEGKTAKQACLDSGVDTSAITAVKNMFPLFLGLPRAYQRRE